MRVLSLFSGIGGLDLGLRMAVQHAVTAAYCECGEYPREVLTARMADGRLDTAPVYDDVRRDWSDLAGQVDAVIGGFPCQDVSSAGKQAGIHGARSGLFFDLARAIRDTGARFCFLENVAALVVRGLDVVLGELDAIGFDAEWGCLRASDVGAPHQRNRWFLFGWRRTVADAVVERRVQGTEKQRQPEQPRAQPGGEAGELADADEGRRGADVGDVRAGESYSGGGRTGSVADSAGTQRRVRDESHEPDHGAYGAFPGAFPPGPSDRERWAAILAERPDLAPALPAIRRVADGAPDWVVRKWDEYRRLNSRRAYATGEPEFLARFVRAMIGGGRRKRLAALGNSVVPAQAAAAYRELIRRSGVSL